MVKQKNEQSADLS